MELILKDLLEKEKIYFSSPPVVMGTSFEGGEAATVLLVEGDLPNLVF